MEALPDNPILGFNPDTLRDVRRQFHLDDVAKIHESVDLIEAWLQKQAHHVKKDYPRSYLERTIIFNKGSVERAKVKIDNICKFRALLPQYFGKYERKDKLKYLYTVDAILPRLTPDHERVYFIRDRHKKCNEGLFYYFKYTLCLAQYMQAHDYNNGFILVCDYMDADIYELFKVINIVELKQTMTIITEGYCMRIKGVHILSKNRGIDMIVKIFKQILSEKLGDRIMVHKTLDTLYDFIPKHVLPIEYGGTEKSLETLYENNLNEITSAAFEEYLEETSKAVTIEKLRPDKDSNTEFNGLSGTFRSLTID
ncbi:alpha-tocopherol transfer protein-like isoform X1 [Aricia agestis]|uniref:alpha-tocopherol transfer protein-like isoform X1 n=1 Tax=Aricia agestis TaxID=91739 RepID=UPI001C202006|nr:alpha-tocopherol transfer protein-like isoform X1 [Aricia agestis]